MNREILFRAYDKYRKEYLSNGNLFITVNKGKRPNKSEIYLDEISNPDNYREKFVIEQHTGSPDKNSKKIFEGDIVRHEDDIGVIEWDKEYIQSCNI